MCILKPCRHRENILYCLRGEVITSSLRHKTTTPSTCFYYVVLSTAYIRKNQLPERQIIPKEKSKWKITWAYIHLTAVPPPEKVHHQQHTLKISTACWKCYQAQKPKPSLTTLKKFKRVKCVGYFCMLQNVIFHRPPSQNPYQDCLISSKGPVGC